MSTLLILVIGIFIVWKLPQPAWARAIQDKLAVMIRGVTGMQPANILERRDVCSARVWASILRSMFSGWPKPRQRNGIAPILEMGIS